MTSFDSEDAPGSNTPAETDVNALFLAFQREFRAGNLDSAERLVHERIDLLTTTSSGQDSIDLARASTNLGLIHFFRKDYDTAERHFTAALDMDRRLNHDYGIARSMGNLALVPEARGELERAEALYREALAIAERIGADEIAASKLANLGDIARARGRVNEARELWTRANAIFERVGINKWHAEYARKLAELPAGM